MATLGDIGEVAAIERLTGRLGPQGGVLQGPGDDCAVIAGNGVDWLLTSDPVIAGVHFNVDAAPRCIGHKAVGRVLSDVAAMGGVPRYAVVDVVAPAALDVEVLDEVYTGVLELAERHGLAVVGGDLAEGGALELHVFAMGSVPHGRAVLRSGARAGDAIYVTGRLGGSAAGRHLAFDPRVAEGAWLRETVRPSAMIDLSDGLATDLRHVVRASGVGARVELARLPLSEAAQAGNGRTALECGLFDGEDFELLFCIPVGEDAFPHAAWRERFDLPCTRIGCIVAGQGDITGVDAAGQEQPIERSAFEHFRSGAGTVREDGV